MPVGPFPTATTGGSTTGREEAAGASSPITASELARLGTVDRVDVAVDRVDVARGRPLAEPVPDSGDISNVQQQSSAQAEERSFLRI
jgi:hypothetical protein